MKIGEYNNLPYFNLPYFNGPISKEEEFNNINPPVDNPYELDIQPITSLPEERREFTDSEPDYSRNCRTSRFCPVVAYKG